MLVIIIGINYINRQKILDTHLKENNFRRNDSKSRAYLVSLNNTALNQIEWNNL